MLSVPNGWVKGSGQARSYSADDRGDDTGPAGREE